MKQLGIVFIGAEGPQPHRLKRLLEDSVAAGALLAAADSGLILAEAAGLKPDWIIGDMDSLAEDRLCSYPPERVIRHPADKDYTDTELALALLREKGCEDAWIAGGGGGRLAHLLGIRDLFEREWFPSRWITAAEDIYCIEGNGGVTASLELDTEPGGLVSVFPLGAGPWKAVSKGLKWPLDNVHWERGLYGLSNTALERKMTINTGQGRFMIIAEGICRQH